MHRRNNDVWEMGGGTHQRDDPGRSFDGRVRGRRDNFRASGRRLTRADRTGADTIVAAPIKTNAQFWISNRKIRSADYVILVERHETIIRNMFLQKQINRRART